MTQDDILRMSRAAWLMDKHDCSNDWFIRGDAHIEEVERFARLVAAAEREACARVCEERYMGDNNREDMEAKRCAAAIRARGEV